MAAEQSEATQVYRQDLHEHTHNLLAALAGWLSPNHSAREGASERVTASLVRVTITLPGDRRRAAKVLGSLARGARRLSMHVRGAPERQRDRAGGYGHVPPPMPSSPRDSPRDTEGDDDLDEMLHQIELDQARGGGLPWSDSADSTVLLPPADSYSPPPRTQHGTEDKPIVLPGAMQDRRIVTKTLGGSHGPPSMNPLAAASASRLLDHARGATFTPVPGQDPRIRTQYFPPTAVAGQDYRVQTHAFPQGLLEGKGISLREGGQSAAAENDSLMRAIQETARASDKGYGGLPVLLEGEMHAGVGAAAAAAGGAPACDDWDSTSASESMTVRPSRHPPPPRCISLH